MARYSLYINYKVNLQNTVENIILSLSKQETHVYVCVVMYIRVYLHGGVLGLGILATVSCFSLPLTPESLDELVQFQL